MAWEIRDTERGVFIVALTELKAWMSYFDMRGGCEHNFAYFMRKVKYVKARGIVAIEVR